MAFALFCALCSLSLSRLLSPSLFPFPLSSVGAQGGRGGRGRLRAASASTGEYAAGARSAEEAVSVSTVPITDHFQQRQLVKGARLVTVSNYFSKVGLETGVVVWGVTTEDVDVVPTAVAKGVVGGSLDVAFSTSTSSSLSHGSCELIRRWLPSLFPPHTNLYITLSHS